MVLLLSPLAFAVPLASPNPGPDREVLLHSDGLPIADGPRSVPREDGLRYTQRAAESAVHQLDLSPLAGRSYALQIQVEDGAQPIAAAVGDPLVSRLFELHSPISRDAPDVLVVRVATEGLVQSMEARTLPVKQRNGWSWGLGSLGGTAIVIGGVAELFDFSDRSEVGPGLAALGSIAVVTGIGLAFRPPVNMDVRCRVFDAHVSLDLTVVPAGTSPPPSPPSVIHGEATERVPDEEAPCTGNMKRLKAQM